MHSKTKSDFAFKTVIYIVCTFLALMSLIPFVIMLINATRSTPQIQSSALSFVPGGNFMHNLRILKTKEEFQPLLGMRHEKTPGTGLLHMLFLLFRRHLIMLPSSRFIRSVLRGLLPSSSSPATWNHQRLHGCTYNRIPPCPDTAS